MSHTLSGIRLQMTLLHNRNSSKDVFKWSNKVHTPKISVEPFSVQLYKYFKLIVGCSVCWLFSWMVEHLVDLPDEWIFHREESAINWATPYSFSMIK